jgi:orotidine-5'-phosphate decarboxylase
MGSDRLFAYVIGEPIGNTVIHYGELLAASTRRANSLLCVGIDPDPAALPARFATGDGVAEWIRLLIEATVEYAAAFKLNLAFFEALGADGMRVATTVRELLPATMPLIVDAKRGDIGSTVAAHARAIFDVLGANATTASPYLGISALAPLLEREDRFVYLLCRTSNPEAEEFQELHVAGAASAPEEPLYLRVARSAELRPEASAGRLGLVIGATSGEALALARRVAPSLPLLVPGVGAQGGDLDAVLEHGGATSGPAARVVGGGLLVNVGRGITAGLDAAADPVAEARARAAEWGSRLAILQP